MKETIKKKVKAKKVLTQKEINEATEKLNRKFKRASIAEKKVIIAQDVLAQLAANKYNAEFGTYLLIKGKKIFDIGKEMKPILNSKAVVCDVCAIGAVFTSCVRINNEQAAITTRSGVDDDNMIARLRGIFTFKELDEMETVFEGHGCQRATGISQERSFRLSNFRYKAMEKRPEAVTDADAILKAIMENIIKNKGKFKP